MGDQADGLRLLMKEIHKTAGDDIKKEKTRIIAVTSGKGGVGKTNIATNMGIAYAQMGKKVIVMDADLGLANVNVILNIIPQYNLYHVIKKQKKMSEIIIDTSAGVSRNVLSFVAAADEVAVITTSEPTAITDAYGIIKVIATEVDNIDLNLKLIVNRVDSAVEAKRIADRMIDIAGQFLNLKIEYLGFIYNDQAVKQAVLKQKPFIVTDPGGKASVCLKHIVARLEKTEIPVDGGFTGFIKKLFGQL